MRVQGQLLYAHIMDMKIQVQRLYGPYLILTRRHHTVQSHQASQYLSPESSGIIGNLAYQLTSSSSNLFYAKSCQRIDANSSWLEYGFHKASTENMQVKPAARHSIARTYPWLQSIWHHCDENQAPGDAFLSRYSMYNSRYYTLNSNRSRRRQSIVRQSGPVPTELVPTGLIVPSELILSQKTKIQSSC